MAINFAAASTAGLNNPGTEIITLVKDAIGNFINPPSYDKMRAYLQSGDEPMLFVTDAEGKTGDIYQFSGYSETENKIRFGNDTTAMEFCAGYETPSVVETAGGGATTLHINVTAVNMETKEATFTADKTPTEMLQASANGPIWCVISFAAGIMTEEAVSIGIPPAFTGVSIAFGGKIMKAHAAGGNNQFAFAVRQAVADKWNLDLTTFEG